MTAPARRPSPAHENAASAVPRLEVFLVPVGPARHELYCEAADDDEDEATDERQPTGFIKGLWHEFRIMLRAAERERQRGVPAHVERERRSWARRIKEGSIRWVAEAIAEQRLLWKLRRQHEATIVYPTDLSTEEATRIVRTALKTDADKHRRWLIIDALLLIVSGALFLVPGPNIIAYYFAFRVVGHYLSLGGARKGLASVVWRTSPSQPLAELRRAAALPPAQRQGCVREVEARLQLQHLAAFFERTAIPGA